MDWWFLGVLPLLWIICGVYWVARQYPGYSHKRQFLSELGAVGSPTQWLSPRINNFPLGLMFIVFGVSLLGSRLSLNLIGVCIVLHGLATWMAGRFAMDADPYTKSPSMRGKLHGLAGLVMMLTLLLAPLIGCVSSSFPFVFRCLSAACLCLAFIFAAALAKAYKARGNCGLFQRLSYASQLVWLAFFALYLGNL